MDIALGALFPRGPLSKKCGTHHLSPAYQGWSGSDGVRLSPFLPELQEQKGPNLGKGAVHTSGRNFLE